jgi:2-polyprenyl-3-methyl-5-hydroxy-6-metoxy-1,4-benzoquinol methylase
MSGCPLCGNRGELRFRLHGYDIHRCHACNADFNASFVGGGGDGQLFSRQYFEVQHKEAFAQQLEDYRLDPSLPVFARRLSQIEQAIGVGRVVDVGPGLGTFLRVARDRGWHAEGVEMSTFASDFIRKTHQLDVFTGELTEFAQHTAQAFDLITFWDSVEHVAQPLEVLQAARRLLSPSGYLVIATDNFDCLVADIGVALYRASGGRVRYPVERVYIDRNRTYFTERSLLTLLGRLGLRVVYSEKMEYPLRKIRATVIERAALATIYAAARLTRRQAQLTLFAVAA